MKNINRLLIVFIAGFIGSVSCNDFEEVNTDPLAVGPEAVKPQYLLNNSIVGAQQDPHVAERIVVYNWGSASRTFGEMTYLVIGRYSDSFNNDYFSSYLSAWIKNATLAIQVADEQIAGGGLANHELAFYGNVKQFARIWRVYVMSEFADNFGPQPINAFQGENPAFDSEKDVYYFMLDELAEATAAIDLSVTPTDEEAKCDPCYSYDPAKWAKYGNSMRMRLAMRLSEVDNAKAKSEFEAAAKGSLITAQDDAFLVAEKSGWDALTGIMTRSWNDLALSSTMCNLLTNLGGISTAEQKPGYEKYIKPENYLGVKYEDHWSEYTDNPTKQYWLDGLPAKLDPRALAMYYLPADTTAENYWDSNGHKPKDYYLLDEEGENYINIDATCCWNGYPVGARSSNSTKVSLNQVISNCWHTLPMLGSNYRNSTEKRVFFGPWETYFLLAEASVYGWDTGTTAETAYENGVRSSFEYFGVEEYADAYLQSEDYNRVGTSVKFSHTEEPAPVQMDYVDGYAGTAGTTTYAYPDASRILYSGKKLNDQLTKIITQKYIANSPWLTLELWSDYRRLGLPFFDIPAGEDLYTGMDISYYWTKTSYLENQKVSLYPQRLRYPTSLKNSSPEGYEQAVQLLGGEDNTMTPLWWAKH